MPYFPVDDQFAFHPKALAAGNAAVGLWTRAGSWSKQHATGGKIPSEIAQTLGKKVEINRLVSAALWLEVSGGYQFHDWDHQAGNFDGEEEKARREAIREKDRVRKREQREREKSQRHADGHAGTPDGLRATPSPVPVPSPLTDVTKESEVPHQSNARDGDFDSEASAMGIKNLGAASGLLSRTVGQDVSPRGALELVAAILSKSKREVLNVDAYVAKVCRDSAAEVERAFFDLDIGAYSAVAS